MSPILWYSVCNERERVGLEYNKKKEREGEEEYREGGGRMERERVG